MKEITVQELKSKIDSGEDFQLIDVREDYEYETGNINGTHIPMGTILENLDKIERNKTVVVHCRSGARSANVINYLEQHHQFTNLYNLKGGIVAYAREIDPNIAIQ